MDLIDLAQERDRWRALVNKVMNLRAPKTARNFLPSCEIVSFLERLCFVKLVMCITYM